MMAWDSIAALDAARAGPFSKAVLGLAKRVQFRPLIYGYANARVHALASKFLAEAQMMELAKAPNTAAIIEMLERGIYKEDLVALSLKFRGEELVELATSRHFAKFAHLLLKLTPPDGKEVMRAMLSRHDAQNVKTMVLARSQGKKFETIAPYLVFAHAREEKELRALMESPDAQTFMSRLSLSPFGGPFLASRRGQRASVAIKKRIGSGGGEKALELLHDALDAYPFELVGGLALGSDADSREVRRLLDRLADEKNLTTVMRMACAGEKPEAIKPHLLTGGTIAAHEWMEMISNSKPGEMLLKLKARRRIPLAGAIEEYDKTGRLSMLEVTLAQNTAREGLKAFQRSGLGVGVIVGALLLKEQEMANIRKIMRARALGLGEQAIAKILVIAKKQNAS